MIHNIEYSIMMPVWYNICSHGYSIATVLAVNFCALCGFMPFLDYSVWLITVHCLSVYLSLVCCTYLLSVLDIRLYSLAFCHSLLTSSFMWIAIVCSPIFDSFCSVWFILHIFFLSSSFFTSLYSFLLSFLFLFIPIRDVVTTCIPPVLGAFPRDYDLVYI